MRLINISDVPARYTEDPRACYNNIKDYKLITIDTMYCTCLVSFFGSGTWWMVWWFAEEEPTGYTIM